MRKVNMAKQTEDLDIFQLLELIEQKKQPEIEKLLEERKTIDEKLSRLGHHEPATAQKRPATAAKGTGTGKGERVCSICHEKGHNARTCPNKANAAQASLV